jgi:hypothetical protein
MGESATGKAESDEGCDWEARTRGAALHRNSDAGQRPALPGRRRAGALGITRLTSDSEASREREPYMGDIDNLRGLGGFSR